MERDFYYAWFAHVSILGTSTWTKLACKWNVWTSGWLAFRCSRKPLACKFRPSASAYTSVLACVNQELREMVFSGSVSSWWGEWSLWRPRPRYTPNECTPVMYFIGDLVGLRADLDADTKKNLCSVEIEPRFFSPWSDAYRLCYPGCEVSVNGSRLFVFWGLIWVYWENVGRRSELWVWHNLYK